MIFWCLGVIYAALCYRTASVWKLFSLHLQKGLQEGRPAFHTGSLRDGKRFALMTSATSESPSKQPHSLCKTALWNFFAKRHRLVSEVSPCNLPGFLELSSLTSSPVLVFLELVSDQIAKIHFAEPMKTETSERGAVLSEHNRVFWVSKSAPTVEQIHESLPSPSPSDSPTPTQSAALEAFSPTGIWVTVVSLCQSSSRHFS